MVACKSLHAILQVMILDEETHRWLRRVDVWRGKLAELGLDGLLAALTPVAHPLGALSAQVLWIAEGALGPLDDSLAGEAEALARLLDDPVSFDHLLGRLTTDTESVSEAEL